MSKYFEPVNDGLVMRAAGEWVKFKLDYLSRYIDIFETSMRRKWDRRFYIDLLSGPGKNRIKKTNEVLFGSPLIALTTKYPFTNYIFNEIDNNYYEALAKRLKEGLNPQIKVDLYNSDCNLVVDEIIRKEGYSLNASLNFCFLDPEGLNVKWSTMEKLANVRRMDILFFYPQEGIARNIEHYYESEEACKLDEFFGDREWRYIYTDLKKKNQLRFIHRHFIDYYKSKLQQLGYIDFSNDHIEDAPLIRSSKTKAPLYRLVFASKHELGNIFWKKISKIDFTGQKRLF